MTFEQELTALINKYSAENDSDTPDFILAEFVMGCLKAWNVGVQSREQWYGRGTLASPSCDPPAKAASCRQCGEPCECLADGRYIVARRIDDVIEEMQP